MSLYEDYDRVRYVYETEIRTYEGNALAKAAERACTRSAHMHHDEITHGFAYRVIDNRYAYVVDAEYDEWGTETKLEIIAFPILKVTPTGFRICRGCRGREDQPNTRFVSTTWTKQWANRTPEGALRDYIARRKRQASIYEARAASAKVMVGRAERLIKEAPAPGVSTPVPRPHDPRSQSVSPKAGRPSCVSPPDYQAPTLSQAGE